MRAYERFLNYVKVWTTSSTETHTHPSTERQFDLAHMLVKEMRELGIEDARVDEKCYVYGTLPATAGCEDATPIGLISHMDTSPDASGENVKAILHENYDGGELVLPATGAILDTKQFPCLKNLIGQTVITTDGTTLLGADDKAGIAEILTLVEKLQTESIPHGKLCIGFTPDEEIGEGANYFDIDLFGAKVAYTCDGDDVGEFSYENFNGASAVVTVKGFSIHPGSAKDLMINAQNVAMEFHMSLPQEERPEHTEDKQGFYHLHNMRGNVSEAVLTYIIRDHDHAKFEQKKERMVQLAQSFNEKYGSQTITLELVDSYYNMADLIKDHWEIVEKAHRAIELSGLVPTDVPVRGGTDGARLTYMGLPCPNVGTGGYNWHGESECISVEGMDKAVEILLHLVELWRDDKD
jgi:tripeptide aminopeptidase